MRARERQKGKENRTHFGSCNVFDLIICNHHHGWYHVDFWPCCNWACKLKWFIFRFGVSNKSKIFTRAQYCSRESKNNGIINYMFLKPKVQLKISFPTPQHGHLIQFTNCFRCTINQDIRSSILDHLAFLPAIGTLDVHCTL